MTVYKGIEEHCSTQSPAMYYYDRSAVSLRLNLAALLFSEAKPFMQFLIKRASWETFPWKYMRFGPVVQMSSKDIYYLELSPLRRRHHEEQFCEIILNLDQWFRRKCRLRVFLIWSSGSPFVQLRVTLVEGIMRNSSVKSFWFWVSGSGDVVWKISYL